MSLSITDQLFPDRGRSPYYIFAPNFSRFSAGSRVLHVLGHLLNLNGQVAYLVPENPKTDLIVNPDLATPLLTTQIVEDHFSQHRTPIVVYPETVVGNPLQAPCVVRFLLNYPGLLDGPKEFPPEDLLIWFSSQMKAELRAPGLVVSIPVSDPRLYHPPPPGSARHGSCFYASKFRRHSGEELSPLTRDSVEIPGWSHGGPSQQEIAELFRRSEVFYCYESSALCLEAHLCGCPVILIPSKFLDKPIIMEQLGWAGTAWGNSPDEWERAKKTVDSVRQKYEQWMAQAREQVLDFVRESQAKARALGYSTKIQLLDPLAGESSLKRTLRLFVPPAFLNAKWKIRQHLIGRPGS